MWPDKSKVQASPLAKLASQLIPGLLKIFQLPGQVAAYYGSDRKPGKIRLCM